MQLTGDLDPPPFAPPFLMAGSLVIAQTANILLFLGRHEHLAPRDEGGRLWVNQLQLTIADLVAEAHDVHHPIAGSLYYEDQKDAAPRRAEHFREERIPKFLGYFERILASGGESGAGLAGEQLCYADLSLFQAVRGLQYAFPNAMAALEPKLGAVLALTERVERRPNIARYLAPPAALRSTSRASSATTPSSTPAEAAANAGRLHAADTVLARPDLDRQDARVDRRCARGRTRQRANRSSSRRSARSPGCSRARRQTYDRSSWPSPSRRPPDTSHSPRQCSRFKAKLPAL